MGPGGAAHGARLAPSCTKAQSATVDPSSRWWCTACPTGCGASTRRRAVPPPLDARERRHPDTCSEGIQCRTGACDGDARVRRPSIITRGRSTTTSRVTEDATSGPLTIRRPMGTPDQKFRNTVYNTNTGTINLDVNGVNGDIAYVKDAAGNVLYAADKTARVSSPTPRSTSTRCARRRCSARASSRASARRSTSSRTSPRSRMAKPRPARARRPHVLRQVLFLRGRKPAPVHARRAGAPARPRPAPPTPDAPARPPTLPPAIAPFPNAAPLRTLRSRSTARVR